MTAMPDILELAPQIRWPVLYLRGGQENAVIERVTEWLGRTL
jgi:hypothetical protein